MLCSHLKNAVAVYVILWNNLQDKSKNGVYHAYCLFVFLKKKRPKICAYVMLLFSSDISERCTGNSQQ